MRTAHRCGVAVSPKSWQRFAIPRLGCCGGQAIRILRRHAAGWQPNQLRRWLSSGLNSKTEWPCIVPDLVDTGSRALTTVRAAPEEDVTTRAHPRSRGAEGQRSVTSTPNMGCAYYYRQRSPELKIQGADTGARPPLAGSPVGGGARGAGL